MQKLINTLAVLSFLGTASIIGGGVYVYLQKDAIIEGVKERVTKAAVGAIGDALPGMLDSAVPKLPEVTGPAVPSSAGGNVSGTALPF